MEADNVKFRNDHQDHAYIATVDHADHYTNVDHYTIEIGAEAQVLHTNDDRVLTLEELKEIVSFMEAARKVRNTLAKAEIQEKKKEFKKFNFDL